MELRHDARRNESRDRHHRGWKPFSVEMSYNVQSPARNTLSRDHYDCRKIYEFSAEDEREQSLFGEATAYQPIENAILTSAPGGV